MAACPAASVRGEPRIRQGIPRERDGPLGSGRPAAGLFRRELLTLEDRGGRPALPAERQDAVELGFGLRHRSRRGIALSLGLVELETQIGLVQDRQHLPLLDGVTDVDEAAGDLPRNAALGSAWEAAAG